MPTLHERLNSLAAIVIPLEDAAVARTVANDMLQRFAPGAVILTAVGHGTASNAATLRIVIDIEHRSVATATLTLLADGAVELRASRPDMLWFAYADMTATLLDTALSLPGELHAWTRTFAVLRPVFDLLLTQWARGAEGFDRESHVRELARLGFTHVEVNGLAFPEAIERRTPGEVYPCFYTYCPALDQFVSSRLNRGAYPASYLRANLEVLKTNAALAAKYGLAPGLVCFEPRSVPDELLAKYPMLRGARVDHPIRSFRPRYNLSIGHPAVREHYEELVEKLLREVPGLDYLSVWSNDSGAGFEYTSSLYVGRNGGGYVIREWKGDTEVAEAAANNIARFMRLLRDAGRRVNPRFRTLLRLEAFWAEMDHLWPQFEEGIAVEASSLCTRGWRLNYTHPNIPEAREIHLTALHNHFLPAEETPLADLRARASDAEFYFSAGTSNNHEPLLGIPFPWLVADKLRDMAARGVHGAACMGGIAQPSLTPFNANQEMLRGMQSNAAIDVESFLLQTARGWVGADLAADLVEVWRCSDDAYRAFPVPIWIYSSWGVWYRLLTRPIVPDIEAIPETDRAYYETQLLATSHNRCRIDFRYDVGFDLVDPAHARFCVDVMDRDLFPILRRAERLLAAMRGRATDDVALACITDCADRMTGLRCWYRNQRNVAAWVAGVHGWLESDDAAVKADCKALLHDMVLDEIENTRELHKLWIDARTMWMILSDTGETTFVYDRNFGERLLRKIALMLGRENDDPRVDPDFQWRVPGAPA